MSPKTTALLNEIRRIAKYNVIREISNVKGLLLEVTGLNNFAGIRSICEIQPQNNKIIKAEVIGFNKDLAMLMAFDSLYGISTGAAVHLEQSTYIQVLIGLGAFLTVCACQLTTKVRFMGQQAIHCITPPPAFSHQAKSMGET